MIWRLIKLVAGLALLGVLGLAAYAYLGDLRPAPSPQSQTVTLDAD